MTISKLLIANRGEIAVRIMRTARRMGIICVAIYSEVDRESLHVEYADEAYCIGHSILSETYLNIEKIIAVAHESGCDAVHPGYGFLAENPAFVAACKDAGLLFVGPDVRAMKVMGNKIEARRFVESIGVPVTKGLTGDADFLVQKASSIGFPVLVKAAAGGGGKGMRIVRSIDELKEALESTSREAANYFADGTVYLEKYIENPRHIEFQLLGDTYGNIVHLFERECSIQRRYQKIIEEAPSPSLTPEVRQKMGEASVAIGKAIGYSSAGTIEFLVDADLAFYFLEMNTRIQVEHPVTELTTGIDIVEEQLLVASGGKLRHRQEDLIQHGHAIECRIYAEDPGNNFLPSPGKMSLYQEPRGEHIRIDTGIAGIPVIQSYFDPMISKLIVWGEDRSQARQRMIEALLHYHIHGISNNISYLLSILNHAAFIRNAVSTKYCDEHTEELLSSIEKAKDSLDPLIPVFAGLIASLKKNLDTRGSVWEQIGYWRHQMNPQVQIGERILKLLLRQYDDHGIDCSFENHDYHLIYHIFSGGRLEITMDGNHYLAWVSMQEAGKMIVSHAGFTYEMVRLDILPHQQDFSTTEFSLQQDIGNIVSPMPGKIIKIAVEEGQNVQKGDLLLVVEAMKMENNILSPGDGKVDRISASVGDLVDGNTRLVHLVV
jgi:3-methylcrotonyl-CoA carboxylase alpha subunit